MWKRPLCAAILASASFGVCAASGDAGSYPNKTIRIINGFAPGGSTDYVWRVIGAKITERYGQTVLIDSRPGAGGTVGAAMTARATPDGYTLHLMISTILASSPSLYTNPGYDLMKDFAYVGVVATGTLMLVAHPSVPAKSVSELLAFARSKTVRYGSSGVGTNLHLAMEQLRSRTGMDLLHIPYKGGAPTVAALAGGEVDIVFASFTTSMPLIKANKLNALAVGSAKRNSAMPEVPTVAESGYPGFDVTDAFGLLAPARTPAAVVKLLNTELRNIVQMEDVRAKLATQGLDPAAMTPEEFKAFMASEIVRWARVIKDANISPN
ncbi:MAG: tripartite tricarboxylate transporter substrate binding protein [Betaproteobacteria bacterium]|nr:tripartite tricarboxylate transporter substrate binding protein [Betaproteobacteria bacterium]